MTSVSAICHCQPFFTCSLLSRRPNEIPLKPHIAWNAWISYFAYRIWLGTWYVMFCSDTALPGKKMCESHSLNHHHQHISPDFQHISTDFVSAVGNNSQIFEGLTLLKKNIFTISKSQKYRSFCCSYKHKNDLFLVACPQFFVRYQRMLNYGWIPGQTWTSPLLKWTWWSISVRWPLNSIDPR